MNLFCKKDLKTIYINTFKASIAIYQFGHFCKTLDSDLSYSMCSSLFFIKMCAIPLFERKIIPEHVRYLSSISNMQSIKM